MRLQTGVVLCWLALSCTTEATNVPAFFLYQGRVAVDGTNFHGTGLFKFALVSQDGSTSYWSHDLSSVSGSEPASSLPIPVERGLFFIQIGNTNIAGMAALPTNLFASVQPRLRV